MKTRIQTRSTKCQKRPSDLDVVVLAVVVLAEQRADEHDREVDDAGEARAAVEAGDDVERAGVAASARSQTLVRSALRRGRCRSTPCIWPQRKSAPPSTVSPRNISVFFAVCSRPRRRSASTM